MTLQYLLEKRAFYKECQLKLIAEKDEKLKEMEQKVLEYRLALAEKLENDVKEYSDKLHEEYDAEYVGDLAKADDYIELLDNLIKELSEQPEDKEEGEVNE